MAAKKQDKKPEVPNPFLRERDDSERSDRPEVWSDEAPSKWMFPLHWFLSDMDDVDLDVCRIRRLAPNDIDEMRAAEKRLRLFGSAMPGFPMNGPWSDFNDREFPWVIQMEVPPRNFRGADELTHMVRRSVEAILRIVGNRYVFTSSPIIYQLGVEDSLKGQYVLTPRDLFDVPSSFNYYLAAPHIPLLKRVYRAALDSGDGRVRVALRRFRRGYGRVDDDALIDLWIGLEALFGDRGGEITYKAAMRIAHYTGQGSWVFRDLQASYNVRSAIVHGDHPANTGAARRVAQNALRFSLLKLLSEGHMPDVRSLDDAIAVRGSYESGRSPGGFDARGLSEHRPAN